jgi:nitrate reductase gamma subunit
MDGPGMMKQVGWAQVVIMLRGNASRWLDGVEWIDRIHLILGVTIFLVFPFTRLMHIWSAPVEYFTRRYQVVRA